MHLVELIPTAATRPEILDQLETFLTSTLGKGVVRAKDTPNFIANRVGIFGMLATIHEAEKFGLSVDVVDDLTGAKLGRAKSGTFRTADVVGLDTMGHVIKTMQDTLQDDPFFSLYKTPDVLAKLIEKGALGQKTGGGFYKKVGKDIQRLDFATGEYVAGGAKAADIVGRILKEKDPVKKFKAMRESTNPQAQFLWAIYRDAFHYIAVHLDTIADNARDIDFAMRWGFGWSVGPFETWQAAGWTQIAQWVKEDIDAGKALSTRRCRLGVQRAGRRERRAHARRFVLGLEERLRAAVRPAGLQAPAVPRTGRGPGRPGSEDRRHHRVRRRLRAPVALGRRSAGHLAEDQDARDRRWRHQGPQARHGRSGKGLQGPGHLEYRRGRRRRLLGRRRPAIGPAGLHDRRREGDGADRARAAGHLHGR
jgi:3-hydroxyacyl-CoA dehydrogenase